jgi:hypothetical protein
MYTLLNKIGLKSFLVNETAPLTLAWVIAEMFYKFGSFTLETGAFMITWYIISLCFHKLLKKTQ